MYSKKTTIQNPTGLHARPASDFISASSKFKSKIVIKKTDGAEEANAKSIVMLLSLSLNYGDEIEIIARGEDEVVAVDELIALVDNKFGEA